MPLVEFVVLHPWRALVVLAVGTLLGLASFYVYRVNEAFGAVAVEEFDPGAARTAIEEEPAPPPPPPTTIGSDSPGLVAPDVEGELALIRHRQDTGKGDDRFNEAAFGEPIDDGLFDSYLLVGTDASGALADTIILALQPVDGGAPIMVSLPRDLYVWNLCHESFTRLNAGLGGCPGTASGPELLAIMVEDYTGIPVDHLARIDFDGFSAVIDAMGGITVCIDNPTRDGKSHLLLETTGCRQVDGETALAWVRSRHPEEMIGGQWRAVSGSDFGRQTRQQDVLFQLAGKAAGFTSPSSLTNRLSAVASSVRLDSSWSFGEAVGIGWRYRGIDEDDVLRFTIDVRNYRAPGGAAVLLPVRPFAAELTTVHDLG